jgi:hypothetical protein
VRPNQLNVCETVLYPSLEPLVPLRFWRYFAIRGYRHASFDDICRFWMMSSPRNVLPVVGPGRQSFAVPLVRRERMVIAEAKFSKMRPLRPTKDGFDRALELIPAVWSGCDFVSSFPGSLAANGPSCP